MANTVTPVKAVQTDLIAWQDITSGNAVISAGFDVSSKRAASFGIFLGRLGGTAFTAGWPNVRIDASPFASGNTWIPLFTYQMAVGASIANTTLSAGPASGAATFTVAAITNITPGDLLFLKDSSAVNYEIVRVKNIATTTVTPEDPLNNAHANASVVTDQAEVVFPAANLEPYVRVRAVVDNAGSGQSLAARVTLTSYNSDTIV
jgi:hypothetical protein